MAHFLLGRCTNLPRSLQRIMHGSRCALSNNVQLEGKTVHYELRGNGPHPLILLPGALGSSIGDFSHQLNGFDGEKFSIVGWDPPGYGQSRPPEREFCHKVFHNDSDLAVKLMKHLGYNKFSVLGWSDGGITGLIMAGSHPEHVLRLVVWGANAYVADADMELYENVRDVNMWSDRMKQPMVDMYGLDHFQHLWSSWIDCISEIHKEGGDLCKAEVRKIMCPTLLVDGFKDGMVAREHPQYLRDHIKHITVHEMPEGKHNLHMRYADEFNRVVETFLTKDQNTSHL